ncbi:MAG: aldolase/citrate lyase family protein [Candidatus Omnitrophota bacterium]
MQNLFRKSLVERKFTLGAWMQIGHPSIAEIFCRHGFDWICVDMEHGAIDIETAANIFRTIEKYNTIPIARLPQNDPVWIHRILDAGAQGLIIPMVKNAKEAENAVCQAKYPPRGIRGFGYSRANTHGIDFDNYIKTANDEIAMIMQIEHKDAIDNLEGMLNIDGVDGVFLGPLDLSGSMGIPGQLEHPDMLKYLETFRQLSFKSGKSFGLHVIRPNEENIRATIALGYNFIALGLDVVHLHESSKKTYNIASKLKKK